MTQTHGKHTLILGVDFRRQQRNFFQLAVPRGYMSFGGGFTEDLSTATGGNGPADLLFGVPQATEQDTLDGLYPTRYWDLAEYVQDDWRVLQNLTINLGLRYEVASPAKRTCGQLRFDQGGHGRLLWTRCGISRRRWLR